MATFPCQTPHHADVQPTKAALKQNFFKASRVALFRSKVTGVNHPALLFRFILGTRITLTYKISLLGLAEHDHEINSKR